MVPSLLSEAHRVNAKHAMEISGIATPMFTQLFTQEALTKVSLICISSLYTAIDMFHFPMHAHRDSHVHFPMHAHRDSHVLGMWLSRSKTAKLNLPTSSLRNLPVLTFESN